MVFVPAGGKNPCSAYVKGSQIPCANTIIDQTLYWSVVDSEDEAIYITALMNSPALAEVIKEHQPRGAFGERHIHKLPYERTPAYDPSEEQHQAVVDAAKALLGEWGTRRDQPDMQACLTPEMHLITRRKKIRTALAELPSWPDYEAATRAIYEA